MKKLFAVTQRCIDPGSPPLHRTLDPVRTEELPIQFAFACLYSANSTDDAMEKHRHSIFGPDLPVSAREFTDEEYKKAFDESGDRKVEWLNEALGLSAADNLFGNMSNKKLARLVSSISEKFAVPVRYK